ncbi:hypothetical protein RGQ29_019817 [Quercus rubra]|uniref:WPP domain-associated protein n=1 Tax=Quercus rubra TaxID=3512 RepID=A0AAN7FB25_QUERU|nr:hypothetical protein RGQ29_019817 [Quercus rubra]
MEDVRDMDAIVALCRDGLGQHADNLQVSEILGDEILENLDSYFQDINDRLTISRMVSDSVIKGTVDAVEQEAEEKIAQKQLEVEKLKHMLHLNHVGADENESLGSALTHHESKSTSHHRMYYNCPDTFVEHDRMKESLGSLRNVAKEQFKKLKEAIDGVRGCSSIRKINSGSELLGLGGILQEKASERWIDVDGILESLNATFDTVHERMEDMFELSRESLCSWHQEQEFKAEIEGMVIKNCLRSLQEGFEERLWDQNMQFGGNKNVNWLEKINDISSLRQELDAISKLLSIHESRPLTSLGSLEISGEWSNDKKADRFRSKSLSNSVSLSTSIWEGNGKHEDSNSNIPENSDPAKLKQMSKDELITEMTNMRRNHESEVQEITEKNIRLTGEILCMKERGSASPLKKDNELDILKRKIPHFISKLDGILVENKMLCAFSKNAENLGSLKYRLESLLSENCHLRDLLADKKKEVTCLLAQVSDAADKMSQRQLFEAKLLCAVEDAQIKALICEDVYKCVLRELIGQIKCVTDESDLKCNIMREIYEIILKEAAYLVNPRNNFNIEDSDIEPIIMQGLCGIIFEEALKDAEEKVSNLNMKYTDEKKIRVSLEKEAQEKEAALKLEFVDKERLKQEIHSLEESIEEKEKLAQETTVALANEKVRSELACQELDNLRNQKIKALEQIETYKAEICELNRKLELRTKQLTEVDEERRMIHAFALEKQNALSLVNNKEREHQKQMELLVALAQGLSNAVAGFECRVTENISNISLRLENLSSESRLLIPNANVLRRTGLSYKQTLERKCSDLEKAEAEVDLLGDEVDALLSLLEKIYIALDHYSPILQHYPGIIEILKLVKRELSGESTRPV